MQYSPTTSNDILTCQRCLMDSTADAFNITISGCNYCDEFQRRMENVEKVNIDISTDKYSTYDALVGVSGGVDSSYVLAKASEQGLKCLAVHLDNGWNSEIAVRNISNLVRRTNTPLITHVIDWGEYKLLQRSFIDNDLLDIELLMDNAMLKVNYAIAKKYSIKNILTGDNTSTEGMRMPENWYHYKLDGKHIRNVAKCSRIKIKTHPILTTAEWLYYEYFSKIKRIRYLDTIEYSKEKALDYLIDKYDYTPYPYKHYESIFTRFYQGYILPNKFNIDKRKIHLSTLIMTGQLTRREALMKLNESPYPDEEQLLVDLNYVLNKLDFDKTDFYNYMQRNPQSHYKYKTDKSFRNFLILSKRIYRRIWCTIS